MGDQDPATGMAASVAEATIDDVPALTSPTVEAVEGEVVHIFAPGDAVVVRAGVVDVDYPDEHIGGWQGRVVQRQPHDPTLVEVDWDSATIRAISLHSLMRGEVAGLKWWGYVLPDNALERAQLRDTEADVAKAIEEAQAKIDADMPITGWLYAVDRSGMPVLALLDEMPSRDEHAVFAAWHAHLERTLQLSFIASLTTNTHRPYRKGDRVTVRSIARLDPKEGTIVTAEHKRGTIELPLGDLVITTRSAANYGLLEDYAEWLELTNEDDVVGGARAGMLRQLSGLPRGS